MNAQPDFFTKDLDAAFADFHAANPGVLKLFVKFAEEAKDAGAPRIGAKLIAERIRWECTIETRGSDFKMNNNLVSRYARLVSAERPDLAPLFVTRRLKS